VQSAWQRQLRDRQVIHWRLFERLPWSVVAKRDGRTERQLRRVVDDYQRHVEDCDLAFSPLERDAVELVRMALDRLEIVRDTLTSIAANAETDAVAVGALRTALHAEAQVLELLQAVGKLPYDLGQMHRVIEERQLAEGMLAAMEVFDDAGAQALEALPVEYAALMQDAVDGVRRTFGGLIGLEPQQGVIEAPVDGKPG